ncbi:MAG TPA: metal ABC transporter permease [Roseimicrobium sp.]|nr:metal ABC transporter permease [Roseimicrobium sp.]
MNGFIPDFSWSAHVIVPWRDLAATNIWIVLMGFLVAAACGLVGNFLILRRMALVGDAISHSVLPGMVVAFLLVGSRSTTAMFVGALAAGWLTTVMIESIHKSSRVKQDAAIGIAFTSLFAIGVILVSLYASKIDLDQECVLYGEIAFVPLQPVVELFGVHLGPTPVFRMAVLTLLTASLVVLFYKELLVSSFDPGLAASLGMNATLIHYLLMGWLSLIVVGAFESVGAILVIGMLILPGATASMITQRLPVRLGLSVVHAALSSLIGFHLGTWLNCSIASGMVVAATGLFLIAWVFGPVDGLLHRFRRPAVEAEVETSAKPV